MTSPHSVAPRIAAATVSIALHIAAAAVVLAMIGDPHPRASSAGDGNTAGTTDANLAAAASRVESVAGQSGRADLGTDEPLVARMLALPRKFRAANFVATGAWLNHVWQSMVFAVAVAFLMLAFRHNSARVRYRLWFASSVKFLVPLSLFTALGNALPSAPVAESATMPQRMALTVAQVTQPFAEETVFSVGRGIVTTDLVSGPPTNHLTTILWLVWLAGFVATVVTRLVIWRSIQRAVRASHPITAQRESLAAHISLRATPGLLEPAVVGVLRPVILVPVDLDQHLTPAQFETVVAHELCHVRRHDNLTALVHMAVEALFWFCPLVWWIGARLIDERERACDEEVVRRFGEPEVYAEGIVAVCRRYVEARLACVAGVSGSDLRTRIEAIMRRDRPRQVRRWQRVVLLAASLVAVAMPVAVGALNGARPVTQTAAPASATFAAASVRPNKSDGFGGWLAPPSGGRLTATNVTLLELIGFAYSLPDFQISGGPKWVDSERFDVIARADGEPPVQQIRWMLRRLLQERFNLAVRTESREQPLYTLLKAKADGSLGPKLRQSTADCGGADQFGVGGVGPPPPGPVASCGYFGFAPGTNFPAAKGGIAFRGLTMTGLTSRLLPILQRAVIDNTGLTGYFDGDFDFIAELPLPPPPPGMPNPFGPDPFASIFTVFPQQLGLKLDSRRAPVEMLVIERAEAPREQ